MIFLLSTFHSPLFSIFCHLQDGKNLFPAPQPNNVPTAAPPKPKSVQELQAEKAAQISPFRSTLTTAGVYTGGQLLGINLNVPLNSDFLESSKSQMSKLHGSSCWSYHHWTKVPQKMADGLITSFLGHCWNVHKVRSDRATLRVLTHIHTGTLLVSGSVHCKNSVMLSVCLM